MKIKNRLSLIFALFFVMTCFLGISLFIANRNINSTIKQYEVISKIHKNIVELNTVTYEVLMQSEKRMLHQWNISYNSALILTGEIHSTLEADKKLMIIKSIQGNLLSVKELFDKLDTVSVNKRSLVNMGAPDDELTIVDSLKARLVSQLILKLHSTSLDSQKMEKLANFEIYRAHYILELTTVIALLSFAVYLAVALFFINRSISFPLTKFVHGTEIIGKGNLEHEIDIKSKDEIGTLASKFNVMRLQLKESYNSLESKVIDKTSELEKERKSLGEKVQNRTAELQNMKDELEDKVNYRTKELKLKYEELARMNRAFVGRELKMVELKKEIKELKKH